MGLDVCLAHKILDLSFIVLVPFFIRSLLPAAVHHSRGMITFRLPVSLAVWASSRNVDEDPVKCTKIPRNPGKIYGPDVYQRGILSGTPGHWDSIEPPSSFTLTTHKGEVVAISSNYWSNKSLSNTSLLEPFAFLLQAAFLSSARFLSPLEGVNCPSSSPREFVRTRRYVRIFTSKYLILNERSGWGTLYYIFHCVLEKILHPLKWILNFRDLHKRIRSWNETYSKCPWRGYRYLGKETWNITVC